MNLTIDFSIKNKEKIERKHKGKSLLIFPSDFIVFDIETTGLDSRNDEIIEIGAIKVRDNLVVDTFNSLIKPIAKIDGFITSLTGITNEMVKDAPLIEEVLPKFMNFIEDDILIGHNVNFDINFIYDSLINNNLGVLKNDFVDTLRLGRRLLPDLKHHRLGDLAKFYNLDYSGSHRSLKDTEITLDVFYKLKDNVINKYNSIKAFEKTLNKNKFNNVKAKEIVTDKTNFDVNNIFYNKYVTFTGVLEKMSRQDAMQAIVDLGGHCEDNVTSKTNYLILGNNNYNPLLKGKKSSKLVKAENLKLTGKDIEIMSESVFYDSISEYLK